MTAQRALPTRRTALTLVVAGAGGAMHSSCGRLGGEENQPTMGPPIVPDAESALAVANDLLADARNALDDAFGELGWQPDPETGPRADPQDDGTCALHPAVLRSQQYLGHELGTPEEIAQALDPVMREHGLPPVDPPTDRTGGWLVTESTIGSLSFSFRSKGYSEISTSAAAGGQTCEVPGG